MGPVQRSLSAGLAALESLSPEWDALWQRCPGAPCFLRPEWALPWARAFAPETARAVVLRGGGRVVGLLPAFVHTREGERVLALLGAGLSDTLDVLAEPEEAPAIVGALLEALCAAEWTWDRVELQDLAPGAAVLAAPTPPALVATLTPEEPHPVLALPDHMDEVEEALSPRFRHNLRSARGRAARLGEVRFVAADEGTVEGWLEELFRLHGCRWTGRGEAGVLASEDVRAFHRQAARGLLARGALRLYALTVGGRVAAMYYGMSDHRRAYAYLGGFDPGFRVLSPGSLVIAHAIAEAVREGAREMDFLRGQEAYKYAWGARDRSHSKLTLRRAPSV